MKEVVEFEALRWVVLSPLLAAAVLMTMLVVLRTELSRRLIVLLSCGSTLVSLGFASWAFARLIAAGGDGILVDVVYTWVGAGIGERAFAADLAFHFDALSAVMCLVVVGVGLVIQVYSAYYMEGDERDDSGYQRFFCYWSLFVGAMLLLVLADNVVLMFLGWQGVGLCSYLLIAFWYGDDYNAWAGNKAFVMNRIGDFGFLCGMLLLFWWLARAGAPAVTFRGIEAAFPLLAEQVVSVPLLLGGSWTAPTLIGLCFFLGACGKSAQLPLHTWLPDSVAGPAPVSALIHAAAIATAGVYMVCRFSFLYAQAPGASAVMAWVGGVTALMAALSAAAQLDARRVLAYSTMSQLGLVFLAAGCGGFGAAIFHLAFNSFVQASLFLGLGIVTLALDQAHDLTRMGGLRSGLRWTHICMLLAALSLAGLPGLSGLFSAGEVLAAAFVAEAIPGNQALYYVGLMTAVVTAFYIIRFTALIFWGGSRAVPNFRSRVSDPGRGLVLPMVTLTLMACAVGWLTPPQFWGDMMSLEGSDSLGNFLANVVAEPSSEKLEPEVRWRLVGEAMAALALGLGLAGFFYGVRPSLPARIDERMPWLPRFFREGFYVDVLYERAVERPVRSGSRAILLRGIDRGLMDGVVIEGGAKLVRAFAARGARLTQSGLTQIYFLTILAGVLAMAGYLMR